MSKTLLWMIVVWFALLQVASPFIHAHLKADSTDQGHGLHMHFDELSSTQQGVTILKSAVDHVQTIGLDKVIVKNMEALPSPLFSVLFLLALSLLCIRFFCDYGTASRYPLLFLQSASRPRAPPTSIN